MSNPSNTRKVYFSVVEDVISNVREAFLDEGVDEQVLQELKQLWESKLATSRALEPPEPEPVAMVSGGNIPFPLQPQTSQNPVHVTSIQQQIPVPVQLSADGQISSAASMAFSAQAPGVYPQQMQALVNVNPGQQLTLQQTANGQFILQALPPGVGVTQGQMMNLQQTIIQAQPGQIQGQTLPQFDGTCDDAECSSDVCKHEEDSSYNSHNIPKSASICQTDTLQCSGACSYGNDSINDVIHKNDDVINDVLNKSDDVIEIEFEASPRLSRRLRCAMRQRKRKKRSLPQLDGNNDTSSSEDDFDDDDDDNNDDDDDKEEAEDEGEEEEPLNTDDDVSEEDPTEVFDTDNVVVCQFEKISRNKGKWKFCLKDGIMNLDGKDHVFGRGNGEADW